MKLLLNFRRRAEPKLLLETHRLPLSHSASYGGVGVNEGTITLHLDADAEGRTYKLVMGRGEALTVAKNLLAWVMNTEGHEPAAKYLRQPPRDWERRRDIVLGEVNTWFDEFGTGRTEGTMAWQTERAKRGGGVLR